MSENDLYDGIPGGGEPAGLTAGMHAMRTAGHHAETRKGGLSCQGDGLRDEQNPK